MSTLFDRVNQGKKIAAGAAVALFACMFLSWFNFGFISYDAWESLNFISPILSIVIVTTLAIALAEATDTDIGDINGGLVIFVLGCLASLLILYRLVDPISIPGLDGGSTSSSVEAGAFLSFVAALGVAVGGYLATDGQAVERLKAMMPNGSSPGAGSQATAAPVAPPPKPRSAPSEPPAPEPVVEPEPQPVAGEDPRSVFCEACGEPMRPNDRFCRKCGHKQADPVSG